jgi:hypothetical protein
VYSLADLEAAKAERQAWDDRWESYSGNNPNKYHSQRNAAQAKVEFIESYLKATGVVPLSDQEVLERELDRLFPEAKSKEIVELQGERYQRRFSTAEKSRSGNVKRWNKFWVLVP